MSTKNYISPEIRAKAKLVMRRVKEGVFVFDACKQAGISESYYKKLTRRLRAEELEGEK